MLTKEGLQVLETVFFETENNEDQSDENENEEIQEEDNLRKALIVKLQSLY